MTTTRDRIAITTLTALGSLFGHHGGDYLVQPDWCARHKQQHTATGRTALAVHGARLGRFEQLLRHCGPPLALVPATRAGARAWLTGHTAAGIEGVVVKDVRRSYGAGRAGWEKVRTRITGEAVIGGVIGPLEVPEVLLLGRPDPQGWLRVAGRTAPLPPAARREVGALLTAPRRAHPLPGRIPSSRFGQLPPQPVDYTRAEPELVVEVDADVCWDQDCWRHPTTYRRLRLDLTAHDLQPAAPVAVRSATRAAAGPGSRRGCGQ